MSKTSRYNGHLQSRIGKIALRIRNRMSELGFSEGELAKQCSRLAQNLVPRAECPQISRERIAKILMNCKARPEKSAAKAINAQEMLVLSRVLKVSLEWLKGQEDNRDPVLWDPLAEPQRAEQIIHLIGEHEEKAGELTVWAEYLMCSLVTSEFMHKSHEARFHELDVLGLHREKQKVVRVYDQIGNWRRKRLLDVNSHRSRTFTQLIMLSELEKIADGTGEYKKISPKLRKECLENLNRLLSDLALGINLIVAKDVDLGDLKIALRDYDSIGVFGDGFTLWGYHSGKIAWSEHRDHISPYKKLLKDFQARAAYRDREKVVELLIRLRTDMK